MWAYKYNITIHDEYKMLIICVTPNKYCRAPEEVVDDFPLGKSSDNHLFVDITNRKPQPQEWWYYDKDTDTFYPPEDTPEDMKFDEIELKWFEFRNQRNVMLSTSDWTQLPDVPKKIRNTWKGYRQKLRDLPQIYKHKNPEDIPLPYPPDRILEVKVTRKNILPLIKTYIKILCKKKK